VNETTETPRRVDPPRCGCTDCITGYSIPLNLATWQVVKAMINGEIQDATSFEWDIRIVVTPEHQLAWPDRQTWAWKYDPAAIAADHDRQEFARRVERITEARS
jgi:hypothetical protein